MTQSCFRARIRHHDIDTCGAQGALENGAWHAVGDKAVYFLRPHTWNSALR